MKRHWLLFILLIGTGLLFGCGTTSLSKVDSVEQQTNALSEAEVQGIIQGNFKAMREEMNQIYETYGAEWTDPVPEWVKSRGTSADFAEPKAIGKEALSPYVSDSLIDQIVTEYLQAYFCECDDYYVFQETDAEVRLNILEQDEAYFKAEALHLYDYVYKNPGTFTYEFEKTDEDWKLLAVEFVSAEESPFDLTFEEIQYYTDVATDEVKEATFIDEIEVAGREYLVVSREDWVDVIDKQDSSLHYEKSKEYND